MPRITINYDSDSDFDRRHLELATHQQIITHYEKVKNSTKIFKKEKAELLEHAMKKALEALKRAEDKLEKANQRIADQKVAIIDHEIKIEEQKVTIQKQEIMLEDQKTAVAQRDDENIVLKTIAMSIRVASKNDDDIRGSWGGPLSGSGLFREGQKRRFGETEEGKEANDGARKKSRM